MNHFNNLPMDVREVILNKKHSLEMEELKTAHSLAIWEFEKELREEKDYSHRVDEELEETNDLLDEAHDMIQSQAFKTTAFYAMAGWCGGYSGDLNCNCFNYKEHHCVKIFAEGIIKNGDFEKFKNSDSTMFIVKTICEVNGWVVDEFLDEIESEINGDSA